MTQLTPEEVNDSYELSIAKRLLRQKFPWVQDIHITDRNDINDYHLIFTDIDVDGEKFLEAFPEASIYPYQYNYFRQGQIPTHSFLNIFFDDVDTRDVENDIDEIFKKVHRSPAIPDELKLPSDRRLSASGFRVDPTKQSPSYINMTKEAFEDRIKNS
jgi:hypothetical protein